MIRKYQFRTSCVNSTAAKINAMVERAREITYKTFIQYVDMEDLQMFEGYTWGPGRKDGLRLKDDWAVRFYRSRYAGQKCVYIDHSSIEYIFTATA